MRPTATREIPTGTVTFLFTDIVGSTELWETQPEAMRYALALHDQIILDTAGSCGGYVFTNAGDSWGIAFADPRRALACAERIREAIETTTFVGIGSLRIRIGIDTGLCDEREGDYFGPPLNRIHRMLATRRGAETILTATTADLITHDLPEGRTLVDLGLHRLDGIPGRHRLYRLGEAPERPRWLSAWILAVFPVVVLVSVVVGLLRSEPAAEPTPTTGASLEPVTTVPQAPPRGELLWTASVPGGYEAVAADGIRAFAVDADGALSALDLATGTVLWRTDPIEAIAGPPLPFEDVVLVADERTRQVAAYELVTGELAYRCASPLPGLSPPAADDGRIFIAAGETPQVSEFRPRSPTHETCRLVSGATSFIRSFGQVEDPLVLSDDRLLVIDATATIHAFDTGDLAGGEVWTYDVPYESQVDPTLMDLKVTEPVFLDYRIPTESGWLETVTWVLFGEQRTRSDTATWRLHRTDLESGLERDDILEVGGPPAAGLGRVFVASPDHTSLLVFDHAMDLETTISISPSEAAPHLDADTRVVYLSTEDGELVAIDAEALNIQWTVPAEDGIESIVSSNGTVVVRHADGGLRAYAGSD
jgi:class 3 adenylate cyclase/outer membrane protein assembly factor BamB